LPVREGEDKTAASVVRVTLSVVSGRETDFVEGWVGGLAAPISGRVDLGGFHQHDRDIVLNGVYTATFAAFQACAVRTQDHRLLANRADQHVEQILRNHRGHSVQRGYIVQRTCTANHVAREFSPVSVGWLNPWFIAFQDLLLSSRCDRIAFRFTARPARWDGSQDSRR